MGLKKLDWLGKEQRLFLSIDEGYLKKGVSAEQRYQKICDTIQRICDENEQERLKWKSGVPYTSDTYTTEGIGKRFEGYIEKNWASFASPILANFGEERGLPISCNHGKISDTLDSILGGMHEVGMLAKYGAGTAKNFSNIRPIGAPIATGGKSEGVMEWIELYAHTMSKVTQGSVRRGFLTAYLTVDHPEIMEFLEIGTKKFRDKEAEFFQTITTAVTIPKGWMDKLKSGNAKCRKIWAKIHKTRNEAGFPYILFEENCNINSPQVYKDKDIWLDNANICIEAIEYCDDFKEFACCLSSANAFRYDEWKDDPNFIMDMNIMLDCVITEYIRKGKELRGLEKAVKFAEEHRAIGLGILGFHSYLQKNGIVFGELESYKINNEIFKLLRETGDRASKWMAEVWGEPEFMKDTGYRNSSRMAQAPTKSTAFIMSGLDSITEGIDVRKSNYNEKDIAKIQVENKNKQLEEILIEKKKNTKTTWRSILKNNGSVQHLDFLSDHEKAVFRTSSEISQVDVIQLAAQRQKYIDMGQSLNLMIHPKTPPKDINKLYLLAYDQGIKSLYYQNSINAAQEFNKELMTCSMCEG